MTKTLKIIIIVCVIGVIGFVVYDMFFSPTTDPLAQVNSTDALNSGIVGQDILILVEKLKMISIDPSVFSSALLTNLVDYSVPLSPEAQGRPNPFAKIGIDNGTVNSQTRSLISSTSTTQ